MHSTIVCLRTTRNANPPCSLEDFYGDGIPPFADYTDELPKSEYASVAEMLCNTFCFLKPDTKCSTKLHVDHAKAKEALRDHYSTLRDLYARMANGEKNPDGISPYWAGVLATGDDYGVHILSEHYCDMNDMQFIAWCAGAAPDTLYVLRAWDYHC